MIDDTINDGKTVAGGGKDVVLAGRYRIIRQLGQGGMGAVWLAEDQQLDNRKVAIKMLPTIIVQDKRAYQQLKGEALVSLKLIHPNIVTLRAFEENDGAPFLVMDYIEGRTLNDYLAVKGKLSEEETIKLLKPIAAALDYAHGEKVVHRDIKPSNILIRNDGHPFILDFGIAREIHESMTRMTGGTISGTLLYMAPEQLRGAPPKPAQDVYSFSAMAYECLAGRPPFIRGQIEYQILNEKPAPLLGKSQFVASIMAGLAKKPEGRPKNCMLIICEERYSRGHGYSRAKSSVKYGGHISSSFKMVLLSASVVLIVGVILCCVISGYNKKRNTEQFLDFFKAAKYDKAAELIDCVDVSVPQVSLSLGRMYEVGKGVKRNVQEAARWYRLAANDGLTDAQCELAWMHENGVGVAKDLVEAAMWYRKAAEQGNAGAQSQMGKMYYNGEGVKQNQLEAIKWYGKAAKQGHAAAQCMLGTIYHEGGLVEKDDIEAIKWYRMSAAQGNAQAQYMLGCMYYNGCGVTQDSSIAATWYRKAAAQGDVNAQIAFSGIYLFSASDADDENKREAVLWLRKAAGKGHGGAQYLLGACYSCGEGVAQNEAEGIKWYRMAAKQDISEAQDALRKRGLSW